MFELSMRSRLALYVLVELARSPRTLKSNEELARALGCSVNHLSKVMQGLARVGWVVGSRGVGGGYRLVGNPRTISMADVVEVFEGVRDFTRCSLAGNGPCPIRVSCGIQDVVREIDEQSYYTLKSVTIHLLARQRQGHGAAHARSE